MFQFLKSSVKYEIQWEVNMQSQKPEADKRKMVFDNSCNRLEYQSSTVTFPRNISVILLQLPEDQQNSR